MVKKITLLVLLFMSVCIMSSCNKITTPGEAALTYVEYVQNGEYLEYAKTFYHTPEAKADPEAIKKQEAEFAEILETKASETFETKGGIKDLVLVSETISEDGKTAKVVINQVFGNGEEDEFTCDMILDEEGVWKSSLNK